MLRPKPKKNNLVPKFLHCTVNSVVVRKQRGTAQQCYDRLRCERKLLIKFATSGLTFFKYNLDKPCEDLNRYCYSWSRRGECRRNPDYMLTYCQRSCGVCPSSSGNTEGSGSGTGSGSGGSSGSNNGTSTSSSTTPASSTCEDKEKHCGYWANHGECEKNPRYMRLYCPRACHVCRF